MFLWEPIGEINFPYLEETLKLFAKDYEKFCACNFWKIFKQPIKKQILIFEDQEQTLMEHRSVALQTSLDAKRKEIQGFVSKD